MRLSVVLPVLAVLLGSSPARATEELSIDSLAVQMRVHRFVHRMAFGFGSLWAISCECGCGSILVRIETTNGEAKDFRIHEIGSAQEMAIGEDALWLSDTKKKALVAINPKDMSILRQIPVPMLSVEGTIAAGEGAVWAVTADAYPECSLPIREQKSPPCSRDGDPSITVELSLGQKAEGLHFSWTRRKELSWRHNFRLALEVE